LGSSLIIFGVDNKKLVEDYPGYFKNSPAISVMELEELYYKSLFEKVYDGINCGLELFFDTHIKRYCFTINEMMCYFFSSFDWNNEAELDHYESHYKLTKNQLIDLIDWYIALNYVFSDDGDLKELKYLEEAKKMIDYYKDEDNNENCFKIPVFDFVPLKEEVLNANYDWYFYTYSF